MRNWQDLKEEMIRKGHDKSLFKARKSDRYILLLEENAKDAEDPSRRTCVFRLLKFPFHTFTLFRELFKSMFEPAGDKDEAYIAMFNYITDYENAEEYRNSKKIKKQP